MAKTPKNQSNPAIGMSGDSIADASAMKSDSKAGSGDFFNALDRQVNGGIQDTEVTLKKERSPQQVESTSIETGSKKVAIKQSTGSTDWAKRYTDSSREAVKWRDKYKEVEKFVPVLQAMKKDSGLVEHVREYLTSGGKPAESIKEKLKLDEDFIFDQQEAMTDPDSDSAKLMNAHVDGLVSQRITQMTTAEQKRSAEIHRAKSMKDQEDLFKKKNQMSEEEFESFKAKAKTHTMTLDDVHYILNRDQIAGNVAQSTKKEMLSQMKNVRNIPTSASGANSQGVSKSEDRTVFENILGFDNSTDNLFG